MNLDVDINTNSETSSRLVEAVNRLQTDFVGIKGKLENVERGLAMKNALEKSKLNKHGFNISKPAEKPKPQLYNLFWTVIHVSMAIISTIYITDEYNNWQNPLIVESFTNSKVEDIPFPAITLCKPLSVKADYHPVAFLRRCVSQENVTSWVCSEEEFNMFRVAFHIYNWQINRAPLTESEVQFANDVISKIVSNDVWIGWNASIGDFRYFQYLKQLVESKTKVKVYNKDFPGTEHTMFLSLGSVENVTLVAFGPHTGQLGTFTICSCQTVINSLGIVPRQIQSEDMQGRKNFNCNPENILDRKCEKLLYSDSYLEIEFENPEVEHGPYLFTFKNPVDYTITKKLFRISKEKIIEVRITPELTNTKKDLLEIDPFDRDCLFSFEKNLSLFDFYTENNCRLECEVNCSITVCGCIPQTILIFNSSFRICDIYESFDCISKNPLMSVDMMNFHQYTPRRRQIKKCPCNCPRDCVSLSYSGKYLYKDRYPVKTGMRVVYETKRFRSTLKYRMLSSSEFVAYALGILGVFNGFSVAMGWKILYWLTVGLWYNIRSFLRTP